jgi:hypothetical protein
MYKLERISMFILNEVETSYILISIRLYFILTILITEDRPQPSIKLSDCHFSSSAGEVSGTQGIWEGSSVQNPESQERAHEKIKIKRQWGPLTFYFDFFIITIFVFSTQIHNFERGFSLS